MERNMTRFLRILNAALAGAASVVIILAVMLPFWLLRGLDYAPQVASDYIIEHTPPDTAIRLQNALGALAMPSALLGGVMYIAMIGLFAGVGYTLIKPRSRSLAILMASLIELAIAIFFFPNLLEKSFALAPLIFTGLILDRLAHHKPLTTHTAEAGFSRREMLSRLALFSFGGLVVSAIDAWPVYQSALNAVHPGRRIADFTPPKARVVGFDSPGLTSEVTPAENFYVMRKFATPIPSIRPDWVLTIDGLVTKPLTLRFEDLLALPKTEMFITRQCVSNPVGGNLISTAWMTGVKLADLLSQSGLRSEAIECVFYGGDTYSESVPLAYARDHGLLIYAMNGELLAPAHGAPLRVELPGLYGFKNMKWLDHIALVDKHYTAIWEQEGWTTHANYKTMSRIDGVRKVGDRVEIVGIAFAGLRGIQAVEIRINDGAWQPAILNSPPLSDETWVQWRAATQTTGALTLQVRAIDGLGAPQIETEQSQYPDGASGLHTIMVKI
jgi:DMSO/TMAO reductase YedYZ molybdopterin-dependent catalytic subunit